MKKVTAKDLLNDQKKRYLHLRQKEQDNSTTEDAKANFRRAPYMGMYQGQNQCSNKQGGV
ncbi:MAG: hypothetical protein K2G55_17305 [Lachnospiraceae bacterium]|nr:hypothetical protein [Lachnospiraceae bacterium]MDE7201519.1 hypothetical protein [Lachnospiraceae bacterium]